MMITAHFQCWRVASQIPDQPIGDSRSLAIEWITNL